MANNYSQDKEFLSNYIELIELRSGDKRVLLSPSLQGRVMTSSAKGNSGYSFGWINYDLLSSGVTLPHCNNFGGEDRFWLGPEGGQFSLFFPSGSDFAFDDWQTPSVIDTEAWEKCGLSSHEACFFKRTTLTNTSGTRMMMRLERKVSLLTTEETEQLTGTSLSGMDYVAYKSENTIINVGKNEWNSSTGMPSIWILGQFISSEDNEVVIPYRKSDSETINDSYFGKIEAERLRDTGYRLYFKADGKKRGKIGIPPTMTIPTCGAVDRMNKTTTIVKFNFDDPAKAYVNSMWVHQQEPFKGDVVNAYNDGPLEDGTIMGGFYEIETSSPAAALKPDERISHTHITIHLCNTTDKQEELIR